MKTVFVGLSGGVDSSVTAALIKRAGYRAVGVYMKNWSKDLPGFDCPWKDDYLDAKRVATQLGIEFELFDFEKEYFDKVVQYMIDEYKIGRTPNPDIMCNQEIKFKLFYETAKAQGADLIATGHYAKSADGRLYKAKDANKDQTYFLHRITSHALSSTLFPLGDFTKPQVRTLASEFGLVTATKKESMGICFVGKVGIKEFLSQYVKTEPGPIIDQNGMTIGEHDGAIYYTIGQRHGLHVGGGLPYYVVDKNMDTNTVFVSSTLDDDRLWSKAVRIVQPHWVDEVPIQDTEYEVRTRYRAPLVKASFDKTLQTVNLDSPVRAVTAGQSAVIYKGDMVLGGGIVA